MGPEWRALTPEERKTYDFIKNAGKIITGNLDDIGKSGVIPGLKNRVLVEVKKIFKQFSKKKEKIRENKRQHF